MAENTTNGNSIASLAKYGGFGVAIAALMLLGYVINSNANGTRIDVESIKTAILSHDGNEQENNRELIGAMSELTKAINEWRIEMNKNRQPTRADVQTFQ